MPLHVWLPPAHAAAPSHVSALMSGVLIKMGILGLVRLLSWIPDPPLWWGGLLLGLGALSGILGVAFALGQHDLKRLLAYHSIENIGIILLGLGLGTMGKSLGHPVLQVLGYAGGPAPRPQPQPLQGPALPVGGLRGPRHGHPGPGPPGRPRPPHALDLRGLPGRAPGPSAACRPSTGSSANGSSTWAPSGRLALSRWPWSVGVLAALALIGALALACFAKAFGAVFLGMARTPAAEGVHESPRSMLVPMGVLVLACALIGLAPALVAPALDRVVAALGPPAAAGLPALSGLASLSLLSLLALAFLGLALVLGLWLRPRRRDATLPTWDCGYAAPSARMQYTASSFADGPVSGLRWVLLPRIHRGRVRGLFPGPAHYESHVPDPVLDRAAAPALRLSARGLSLLRFVQGGHLPVYLLYVLFTLLTLLVWMVV